MKSRATKRGLRSGTSIVEVMIAMTVLMVGVTGTIITNVSASQLSSTSEETRLATAALSDAVEQAKLLLGPNDIFATIPQNVPMQLPAVGLDNLQVTPSYPGFAVDDRTIVIRFVATWTTFDGGNRRLQLTTAI